MFFPVTAEQIARAHESCMISDDEVDPPRPAQQPATRYPRGSAMHSTSPAPKPNKPRSRSLLPGAGKQLTERLQQATERTNMAFVPADSTIDPLEPESGRVDTPDIDEEEDADGNDNASITSEYSATTRGIKNRGLSVNVTQSQSLSKPRNSKVVDFRGGPPVGTRAKSSDRDLRLPSQLSPSAGNSGRPTSSHSVKAGLAPLRVSSNDSPYFNAPSSPGPSPHSAYSPNSTGSSTPVNRKSSTASPKHYRNSGTLPSPKGITPPISPNGRSDPPSKSSLPSTSRPRSSGLSLTEKRDAVLAKLGVNLAVAGPPSPFHAYGKKEKDDTNVTRLINKFNGCGSGNDSEPNSPALHLPPIERISSAGKSPRAADKDYLGHSTSNHSLHAVANRRDAELNPASALARFGDRQRGGRSPRQADD